MESHFTCPFRYHLVLFIKKVTDSTEIWCLKKNTTSPAHIQIPSSYVDVKTLHQLFSFVLSVSLVLKTGRVKMKSDSRAVFQRRFLRLVEFYWVQKIQKHVLDSVAVQLDRKEGKEKELEATGVNLKRTKCRKTLFSSSRRTNNFLLVIAMGSSLLHCSMDDFSKVNEVKNQSSEFLSERTR